MACTSSASVRSVTIGNGFDQTNLIGTEGQDVIHGTNRADFIDGRGGNDLICTFAGKNVVIGGGGDDEVQGGPDGEIIVGDEYSTSGAASGKGNDDIKGGAGHRHRRRRRLFEGQFRAGHRQRQVSTATMQTTSSSATLIRTSAPSGAATTR